MKRSFRFSRIYESYKNRSVYNCAPDYPLNYNKSVQEKWEKDQAGNISKADSNWPDLLKK